MSPRSLPLIKAAAINAAFALILIGAGVVWSMTNALFLERASVTNGTIVDLVSRGRGLHPVVRYADSEGAFHERTLATAQRPSPFVLGEQVRVFYLPENPARMHLDWFMNLWFGPCMLVGFGVIQGILSIIFAITARGVRTSGQDRPSS